MIWLWKVIEWLELRPVTGIFVVVFGVLLFVVMKIDVIDNTNNLQAQEIKIIKKEYVTNENIKMMNNNMKYLMERQYDELKTMRVDVNNNSKSVYELKGKVQ